MCPQMCWNIWRGGTEASAKNSGRSPDIGYLLCLSTFLSICLSVCLSVVCLSSACRLPVVLLYLQAYIERGFFKFTYGSQDSLVEFLHADNFCQAHIKAAEACPLPESPVVREGGREGLLHRVTPATFFISYLPAAWTSLLHF